MGVISKAWQRLPVAIRLPILLAVVWLCGMVFYDLLNVRNTPVMLAGFVAILVTIYIVFRALLPIMKDLLHED